MNWYSRVLHWTTAKTMSHYEQDHLYGHSNTCASKRCVIERDADTLKAPK